MTRSMNRILGVAGAVLLITLLAIGIGAHPDVRVSAASCSVSGVISTDTTWSPTTCDPYIVTASVVVPSGVTLTIEAGTTVKFDSLKGLLVQGTLVARGTASNAITFTSNQATPAKGDWGNIHFMDSSTDATFDGSGNYAGGSIVQYAIIEYAGYVGVGTAIGALTIEASSPYIDHNTIRNNRASGIYASASGALRVTNNTITGTSAGEYGGGIYVQRGTVTISSNTITNNTVAMNQGGGIYVEGSPVTITISSNTITGNTVGNPSYPSNGGGISAGGIGTVTITNNTITGNTGSTSGGGIYAQGTVTITSNTITGNTITGNSRTDTFGWRGLGGGVYFGSGTATITDNFITGNSARNGGGIYLRPSTLVGTTINNNDLYGNKSGSSATPIDLYNEIRFGSANVNAKNNYWGTTDPSVIEDHIWHFLDDWDLGLVDYIPFRASSIGLTLTPSPTPTPTPTATPTPTPSIPNLSVMKLATTADRAYPGETLAYLIFLDNSGPTGLTVALKDAIPAGASYISGTVSGGAVYSPSINAVFWSGTVQPGASTLPSQVFQFRVRIDPDISTNAITNTVLVSDGSITTGATARTEIRRWTFLPALVKSYSAGW